MELTEQKSMSVSFCIFFYFFSPDIGLGSLMLISCLFLHGRKTLGWKNGLGQSTTLASWEEILQIFYQFSIWRDQYHQEVHWTEGRGRITDDWRQGNWGTESRTGLEDVASDHTLHEENWKFCKGTLENSVLILLCATNLNHEDIMYVKKCWLA